ncbi:MAG: VgrG-related protein [Propionibacteriaceae bacterium]|nr:VgrG-related protein [Propionibacteriaceae bacterium]
MADDRLDGAVITVDSRQLSAELHTRLTSVRVEESSVLPDVFELRFEDAYFKLFDDRTVTLGQSVEIAMRAEGSPVVITSGEVTSVSVEPGAGGRHELVVTGMDLCHRLARVTRRRTFSSMSDADIAGQIASEYSLQADVEATTTTHDLVLQANETDLAFLRRRAARNGHTVWITDRTLHVRRRPAGQQVPKVTWGQNLLDFTVRFSSIERADEVHVRGWDPVGKQVVVGRADQPAATTDAAAAAEADDQARSSFGRIERTAVAITVGDQREADAVADALLARAVEDGTVLRGVAVGDPEITAGANLDLDGVGSRLSGRYLATGVTHLYVSGKPYTTRFVCGPHHPAGLADLVGARGLPSDLAAVTPHLLIGEVTNTSDPLGLGRVRLRLPAVSTDDETDWARIVAPGGGPDRGIQWLPEINDEVLVGFEQGDPARPCVLGGLWNHDDTPPDAAAATDSGTARWSLTSRKGTKVILHDDPTEKVELVVANSTSTLVLSDDEVQVVGARKLTIGAQEIAVEAQGRLSLKGSSVSVQGDSDVTVSGSTIRLN